MDSPILDRDLQSAAGKRSRENEPLGALGDIDETAGASEPGTEAAHIDIACSIRLRHPQTGKIKTSAIVEIKLLVLVQHRIRIKRGTEIEPPLRHSADDSGLRSQGQVFEQMLFSRYRGDTFRHPYPEIDDAAGR
jgi:hypothetical protein